MFLATDTVGDGSASSAVGCRHWLRLARVSRWVWVGYETNQPKHRDELVRVGPYSCRERLTIGDADELVQWIESGTVSRMDSWLVSHRLGFDAQVGGMLDAIRANRWRFDSRIKQTPDDVDADEFAESSPGVQVLLDPPTILSLRVNVTNRLIAIDSRNYWRNTIDELAESVGVRLRPRPGCAALDRDVAQYLDGELATVERAFLGLVQWLDAKRFGRLRFSAAGVAMQAFRTAHLPQPLYPTTDVIVRQAERRINYAGEVRTFRLGRVNGPVYQVDVASLYPAVMREGRFPVEAVAKRFGGSWRIGVPDVDLESCAAEVFIRDYREAWPCKSNVGTVFLRGTFCTWLAGPELAEAAAAGIVLGHRSVVVYDCANLFRSWVDDLWQERLEAKRTGDKVRDEFAKLLLNSLYGKFGQRGPDMVQRTDFLAPQDWGRWVSVSLSTGKRRAFQCLNGQPWEEVDRKELVRALPAISAWVTAYGRRRMRQLRTIAGAANVVYQGVDALIVTRRGLQRLELAGEVQQNTLGKLRLQNEAPFCHVRGYGDYQLGTKRVVTGVRPDARALSARRFEFSVFDGLKRHLFLPGPRAVNEQKRLVELPEEAIIGTKDELGFVRAPLRREPIPDELQVRL